MTDHATQCEQLLHDTRLRLGEGGVSQAAGPANRITKKYPVQYQRRTHSQS
jgi:hypothetical protein